MCWGLRSGSASVVGGWLDDLDGDSGAGCAVPRQHGRHLGSAAGAVAVVLVDVGHLLRVAEIDDS